MARNTAIIAIALVATSGIYAQSISDKATNDETVHMSKEEPAMRKAFARAAETLPAFLELAAKPKEGTSSYALKVAISDGRNTEYFWVNSFSHEGNVFAGSLNNEPRLVKKHKLGDRITFQRNQIVDWTYVDALTGKTAGNFTACALLSKEPPEQAAAFMRRYGLSCEQ
ncbi:YegJ family protein [Aquabacterium humicola]|uniref:YegJ family protein n=1 Tax=Aquabacterium humicola TaxID=3237377 RepID=UPI002542E0BD|nr:DUF2314 domain-containing protein [Rubrivivax pictus]